MKILKNPVFTFILGIIISGSAVLALGTIDARDITYTDIDNNEITLKKGIDDLYLLTDRALKPKLLWTNPNPTASFGAQTIELDLSEYKYIIVTAKNKTNAEQFPRSSAIVPVGDYTGSVGLGTTGIKDIRHIKATTTGVTFGVTYWGGQTENNYCIPLKIYGIKGEIDIDIFE